MLTQWREQARTWFRSRTLVWLLILVLLLLLPWIFRTDFLRHLLIISAYHAILALSLNLVMGFAGQISFGQSGFVAVGAYASALLALNWGIPFWGGMLVGGLAGLAVGVLVGLPALRVRGIYLGMVTWGLAEIVRLVALNVEFTRGPMGLPGIPPISLFGKPLFELWQIYYVVAGMLFLSIVTMTRLIDSRVGEAFLAIREDELAARAMGISVGRYKVLAFALSALLAGVAGAFYAHYLSFVSPSAFNVHLSILLLMMIIVGGMGSIPGSLIGAVLLTLIPEVFRFMSDYRLLVYGIALVVMIIFRPQGILGQHRHLLPRILRPGVLSPADEAARRGELRSAAHRSAD
jgi:branched-chain amino acid transport system permease protein